MGAPPNGYKPLTCGVTVSGWLSPISRTRLATVECVGSTSGTSRGRLSDGIRISETHPMDAGVAAVLGAAVGAVGTGLASLAAGWLGARNVQKQIIAQHVQADHQRRFEHARERREPRSQAYAELIAQTQVVGTLVSAMNRSQSYTTDDVHAALEEIIKVLRARARVMVEGPVDVADSTEDLIETITDCRDRLMALASIPGAPPEVQEIPREELIEVCEDGLGTLAEALEQFVEAARQALDADGVTQAESVPRASQAGAS